MNLRFLIISLVLIGLIVPSCQKDELDMKNPDVDQFISILKSGNYFEKAGYELPDFTIKDIEDLLSIMEPETIMETSRL